MKTFLLTSLLFLYSTMAFGQTVPEVIPPSPITREFTKYITQEVSLYNGVPEINIPLYSIQLKGLVIPITLSYHASGIKYAQEDGNVGVGWSLNPGYRVSRSVYGHADELVPMASDFASILNDYETAAVGDILQRVERDKYLSKFLRDGFFGQGYLDGEFDQFIFSTPTANGGFIIADRTNKEIVTTENSNLIFDYKTGGSVCSSLEGIRGFQIIDEIGTKYTFGEYNPQNECVLETASDGRYLATAWGMSDITTPTGDVVQFAYNRRAAGEPTAHIRSMTINEGYRPGACIFSTTSSDEQIFTGHGYYTFYPDQITSPSETVTFSYSQAYYNRKISKIDIASPTGNSIKTIEFFYSDGSHHTFLDSIEVKDSNQATIETYRFEYHSRNSSNVFTMDHFGNYLIADNGNVFFHQEFSDDPIVASNQGLGGESYCFSSTMGSTYLSALTVSREPDPEKAPDFFSLKKITYPTGGYTEFEYEHGKFRDVSESWPVRNSGIRIRTIKSFDLVTQNPVVTTYVYGTNESGYGFPQAWVYNPEMLFVREMIDMHAHPMPQQIQKMLRIVTYSSTMQGDIGSVFSQSGYVKYPSVTEYKPTTYSPLRNGKTVYHFDIGHTFDIQSLNTRNPVPGELYQATPLYVYRYRLWDRPLLRRKVMYAYSGTQYNPVQEESYEYDKTVNAFFGLKVEQCATNPTWMINTESYGFPDVLLDRYFNYGQYSIEVGKTFLKRKTEYQYLHNDTITTNYSYNYSNLLISKEVMIRSTGDSMVTNTSYPRDYALGTEFIDDMVANNLVSYPIEQVKYLDDGMNIKILSGHITKYKTGGKGLKDEEFILDTRSPIHLDSFQFSNRALGILPPAGTQATFSADIRFKPRLKYNSYDSHGNVLRITQDRSLSTSYVWGYNFKYPIAKIVNAIYDDTGISGSVPPVYSRVNEVSYENFEEHAQKVSSATAHSGDYVFQGTFDVQLQDKVPGDYRLEYWISTDGSSWVPTIVDIVVNSSSTVYTIGNSSSYIDDIRLHPKDAQMSTYTYHPLIGMTSQTDADGVVTYYEYDAFGRLVRVKDHMRNTVRHVQYNYQTSGDD